MLLYVYVMNTYPELPVKALTDRIMDYLIIFDEYLRLLHYKDIWKKKALT